MNKPLSYRRRSSGGYVLIVVLVVCLGLVSLTLLFGHSMSMAYRGSESDMAGRQADRAIEGAAQYASALMSNITISGTTNYLVPDPTTYQSEAVPVGDATFWFIGEALQSGSQGVAVEGVPSYGLVDEASKLNLNTATETMLENLPNMTQNLAQAIVAWRTTSGTQTTTSAASSSTSSTTKAGPFESIYELAQVANNDGDDPAILYGDDLNLNHIQDASETASGSFTPGIYEYVTVFSREPNMLADGTTRINVAALTTGTNLTALTTLLGTTFTATRAREISTRIIESQRNPVQTGTAAKGSVLQFYINSGITADELDQLTPHLTMNSGTYAVGLINVNTASQAVLQCVPGITEALATQIVATRTTQTTPSTNLAWVAQIIGNAAALQAGPYLTTQSYQLSADVAAVGHGGRGYRRSVFVIDGSSGTPQIVYRRNMATLGWSLGPDALQTLQTAGQQKVTQ